MLRAEKKEKILFLEKENDRQASVIESQKIAIRELQELIKKLNI